MPKNLVATINCQLGTGTDLGMTSACVQKSTVQPILFLHFKAFISSVVSETIFIKQIRKMHDKDIHSKGMSVISRVSPINVAPASQA